MSVLVVHVHTLAAALSDVSKKTIFRSVGAFDISHALSDALNIASRIGCLIYRFFDARHIPSNAVFALHPLASPAVFFFLILNKITSSNIEVVPIVFLGSIDIISNSIIV